MIFMMGITAAVLKSIINLHDGAVLMIADDASDISVERAEPADVLPFAMMDDCVLHTRRLNDMARLEGRLTYYFCRED